MPERSARNPTRPECNPLVTLLAELALAVAARRRETAERRATMTVVQGGPRGGRAA
jgi:hypothetical protein